MGSWLENLTDGWTLNSNSSWLVRFGLLGAAAGITRRAIEAQEKYDAEFDRKEAREAAVKRAVKRSPTVKAIMQRRIQAGLTARPDEVMRELGLQRIEDLFSISRQQFLDIFKIDRGF